MKTLAFNNSKNPYLFRDTLLKLIGTESFPHRGLVACLVACCETQV